MSGVPGIAVAGVVLNEAQIVALVGQREAVEMPQRVRMHARQAGMQSRMGAAFQELPVRHTVLIPHLSIWVTYDGKQGLRSDADGQ